MSKILRLKNNYPGPAKTPLLIKQLPVDAIFGATYVLRDVNFYRFILAKTIREGHLTSQLCKLSTVRGPYLLNVDNLLFLWSRIFVTLQFNTLVEVYVGLVGI